MIILKYCSIQNKLLFNSKYIFPILEILGMEKKTKKEKRKKLVLEIEKLIITFFILFVELRYILLSQFTSFEKRSLDFLKVSWVVQNT